MHYMMLSVPHAFLAVFFAIANEPLIASTQLVAAAVIAICALAYPKSN
jgi:hypothetical protein